MYEKVSLEFVDKAELLVGWDCKVIMLDLQ